ncbi:MAG: hypothetical protein KJ800_08985, partial [Proteobacteria bacterium]|nr:hypothetical protein [Pseudomonadota bacterium]
TLPGKTLSFLIRGGFVISVMHFKRSLRSVRQHPLRSYGKKPIVSPGAPADVVQEAGESPREVCL